MFDASNPAHIAALASEVSNDPAGIGYNVTQTASIIDGLSSETADEIQGPVLVSDLIGILANNAGEFIGIVTQTPAMGVLAHCVSALGNETDISGYAAKLASLVPGTQIASDVLAVKRKKTRAEVLFGEGSVVRREDWIKARGI